MFANVVSIRLFDVAFRVNIDLRHVRSNCEALVMMILVVAVWTSSDTVTGATAELAFWQQDKRNQVHRHAMHTAS